jgi:hypothetical protein
MMSEKDIIKIRDNEIKWLEKGVTYSMFASIEKINILNAILEQPFYKFEGEYQ